MHNSYDRLAQLLCEVPEYAVEGRLNKNIVAELARKYDAGLINKLLSDKDMKKLFFSESDAGLIFKKDIFLQFISQKEFLPDSYTAFEQKIGLASGGTMLRNDDRVVLNWPYKDCILEGGQTKEDAKRNEVFFNEILAPDEINTILEDKVFTNWKRYDKDGEHELDELRPNDNLVIKGNNLVILHSLKKRFAGRIKLVYIDPPYNTGSDSFRYNDSFNHSTWLTFMRNRLEVAKDLLANDGVIFIHCDDNEQAYLKVLMDEIFKPENFISCIANQSASSVFGTKASAKERTYIKVKDYILAYSKTPNAITIKPIYFPAETFIYDTHADFIYENGEKKSTTQWFKDNYKNKFDEINLAVTKSNINKFLSLYPGIRKEVVEKLADIQFTSTTSNITPSSAQDEKLKAGEVVKINGSYYMRESDGKGKIRILRPLRDSCQLVDGELRKMALAGDLWDFSESYGNISTEGNVKMPNGKKPEVLLQTIINSVTNPGDIVLDFFGGSGTTAAVALKMNRQFITAEQINEQADLIIERLRNVVVGEKGGISKSVNWTGGGSFVYCNIKNDANKFREKVQVADDKKMDDLLDEVLHSSFLSYRIDAKNHNIKLGDFHKLSLADKKHVLLDLIDNNTLYLNYSEIDDATYKISDEDKKHNKAFYGE